VGVVSGGGGIGALLLVQGGMEDFHLCQVLTRSVVEGNREQQWFESARALMAHRTVLHTHCPPVTCQCCMLAFKAQPCCFLTSICAAAAAAAAALTHAHKPVPSLRPLGMEAQ
jgi:hypothetical protein